MDVEDNFFPFGPHHVFFFDVGPETVRNSPKQKSALLNVTAPAIGVITNNKKAYERLVVSHTDFFLNVGTSLSVSSVRLRDWSIVRYIENSAKHFARCKNSRV